MNIAIYIIAELLIIFIVAGVLWAIYHGLNRAFTSMQMEKQIRKELLKYILVGLGFWLAVLALLSFFDFFQDFETIPPKIVLFAVLPPVILVIYLLLSKSFATILKNIPPAWLIYVQFFRFLLEIVLWLGFIGHFVPFQMTFEAFNMDIIVGITAVFASQLFFGRGRFLKMEAFTWNLFGLLLLGTIVFIAIISTPSPLRIFYNEPSSSFLASFPFIWIPGFLVPFAFAMHLFSIKQLFLKKE